MNLKQLINKSTYGTIGYIASEDDLARMEQYLLYNLEVLKEYKNIVIATNYGGDFQTQNTEIWKRYFPTCIILDSPINRGHNFGTADLDNLVFDYCKENNIKWLCKGANDVLFQPTLFNIEVDESDFYYMNGFSFETVHNHKYNLELLEQNHFTPQTNFYFIDVSKTDYLTSKEYLNTTYNHVKKLPNYNNKPWEYISKWSCEDFLAECIERNNLNKYHILKGELYEKLFKLIATNQIGDPSHKNIMIQGICHFQFPNDPVLEINLDD